MKYNSTADIDNQQTYQFEIQADESLMMRDGTRLSLKKAEGHQNLYTAAIAGRTVQVIVRATATGEVKVTLNGYTYSSKVSQQRHASFLQRIQSSSASEHPQIKVHAPMPGLLKKSFIHTESIVRKGDNLFALEAMKMENLIKAPVTGRVTQLSIQESSPVEKGTLLCVIERS
jgi:biotin carboxyl carrier protein